MCVCTRVCVYCTYVCYYSCEKIKSVICSKVPTQVQYEKIAQWHVRETNIA